MVLGAFNGSDETPQRTAPDPKILGRRNWPGSPVYRWPRYIIWRPLPKNFFGVRCGRFAEVWGSSAVGLKLCIISPLGCTGGQGRVVAPYYLWDSVSG